MDRSVHVAGDGSSIRSLHKLVLDSFLIQGPMVSLLEIVHVKVHRNGYCCRVLRYKSRIDQNTQCAKEKSVTAVLSGLGQTIIQRTSQI